MKQLFIFLFSFVFLTMTIFANTAEAERITVKIGETSDLAGGKTSVRFVEVVEDSRCPEGVECFWAGNAKIRVEISNEGEGAETLELNTNMGEPAKFNGREVKLVSLTPHPKEGAEIDKAAYTAIIEFGEIKPCEGDK